MTKGYDVKISVVMASIALFLNLLQLHISRKMQLSGFLVLITSLAVSNIIFDIGYYFRLERGKDWGNAMFFYFVILADIAMGMWTNIMSLVLVRIVHTLKAVDIMSEYRSYVLSSVVISIPLIAFSAATAGWQLDISSTGFRIYYWIRIAMIVTNAAQYGLTKWLVRQFPGRVAQGELTDAQAETIRVLVRRMRYYGLVQIITRLGPSWHDYNNDTYSQPVPAAIGSFLGSAVGIGYFALFVYMQPSAYELLRERVLRRYLGWLLPLQEVSHASSRMSSWNEEAGMDDEEIMARISSWRRKEPMVVTNAAAGGEAVLNPVL